MRAVREEGHQPSYWSSRPDVNGDGWPDIISSSFLDTGICWYENPGAEGLARGDLWKKHVLIDTN